MKTILIVLICCISFTSESRSQSQASITPNNVIEGGKLVVELIKAINAKKDQDHNTGCKDSYADLCIENQATDTLTVSLLHRSSGEIREIVILPGGKECCLQAKVGVWTYDLKLPRQLLSIRKGDLKLEGCNNLLMNIK
ncbi:MAG TPA: hypothetical protein VFV79_11705 [Saprospiraceae bacterium]|nr:hypothetical protein [Saprospiraceae bacterium]